MNSSQLPPTEQWHYLLGIFASVAENGQAARLEEEASYFGLTVDDAVVELSRCNPEKALKLFREENPDLVDLPYPDLDRNQQYSVAVALLQLLTT